MGSHRVWHDWRDSTQAYMIETILLAKFQMFFIWLFTEKPSFSSLVTGSILFSIVCGYWSFCVFCVFLSQFWSFIYPWMRWSTRTYYIAQRTLLNVMWQPGWERNLQENGCIYIYMAESLHCSPETITTFIWNYYNIVNWLYSSINWKAKKNLLHLYLSLLSIFFITSICW